MRFYLGLRGVVLRVLDCDNSESVFEFQSRYYVQFWEMSEIVLSPIHLN